MCRLQIIFFLHIVTDIVIGNGGLLQVSEAPKYFGGGVKKRNKNYPSPTLTPHPTSTLEPRGGGSIHGLPSLLIFIIFSYHFILINATS